MIPKTALESPAVTSTAPRASKLFAARVAALVEQTGASASATSADGDVDEEDPLPAERVREDAPEQHACGRAEAADGAPDAECDVALTAFARRSS